MELIFLEQIEDIDTVERQLKFCHLVIISKVDLINDNKLEEVKAKIREINDKVNIVESINGKIDYNFF